MKNLPFPLDAGDEIITKQCQEPGWAALQAKWLAAAQSYRKHRGNPWRVQPAGFSDVERAALYRLYDSRGRAGPINRIRRPKVPFKSCPFCGGFGGRSLDHALPRSIFPEFSIFRENLVPACTMCNTDEKGEIYRGSQPERFIHPYYDRWASKALWQVNFKPDLDILEFTPVALSSLSPQRRKIVNFHVKTLLGKEWRDSVRREWGGLPANLSRRVGRHPSGIAMRVELNLRLEDEIESHGVNCWMAGFLRGILDNPLVIAKLIERIGDLK